MLHVAGDDKDYSNNNTVNIKQQQHICVNHKNNQMKTQKKRKLASAKRLWVLLKICLSNPRNISFEFGQSQWHPCGYRSTWLGYTDTLRI